jgi:hypothetical protein
VASRHSHCATPNKFHQLDQTSKIISHCTCLFICRKDFFSCSRCVQTGSEVHPASCTMSTVSVQTSSEVHPASCTMSTVSPFPGGKTRPGRDPDHSPHLAPRSRMSGNYASSPSCRLHGGSRTVFALFIYLYLVIYFAGAGRGGSRARWPLETCLLCLMGNPAPHGIELSFSTYKLLT